MTDSIVFYSISGCEGKNAIDPSIHTLQVDEDTIILDKGFMSTPHDRLQTQEIRLQTALEKLSKVNLNQLQF